MANRDYKGVYPPMLTPFTHEGDVDYRKFERNMAKWNDANLAGYLVLGSNSETAYLTENEKVELMKIAKRTATPGRKLLVGTGTDCERDTIARNNIAAEMGYDAALVLTPCYYTGSMNAAALIRYFTHVADKSELPVMIYNVPKFTHVNITADALSVLVQHPNIIGMKDSTGDIPQMATWLRIVPEDFALFVGTASAWFPALCMGVRSAILALANTHPNECAAVQAAYDKGDLAESLATYQRVFPVNTAITGTYGIPGLKVAADLMGYEGGFVRSPLGDLTEQQKSDLATIVNRARV